MEIAENHSMEKIAYRKENFTFCVIKCDFQDDECSRSWSNVFAITIIHC